MMNATKLYKALIVKHYIDDILLISESNIVSKEIIKNPKNILKEHDLDFTSTIMSLKSGVDALPFLDVEHIFTIANEKIFFYTRNLKKGTTINFNF